MKKSVRLTSVMIALIMVITSFFVPYNVYAQTTVLKGVDVSEHNKNTDFALLKNQGYDFAMIRLGFYDKLDALFYQNLKGAYDAGMYIGVYLYSYAFNAYEAQVEANYVINTLASLDPAYRERMILPVAYDIEDKKIIESGCGKNEITNNALVFCNSLKAAGYDTMVYANDNWFKNYIDINQLNANGIKIWYAKWTNTESSNITYVNGTSIPCYMWQYQSGSYNTVNGLDQNILYLPSVEPVLINVDQENSRIALSKVKYTYDGKEKKPAVTVYDSYGNIYSASDYDVYYKNNKNPGKAQVVIKFKNNYQGRITADYTIIPKKQAVSSVKSTAKKKIIISWKKDKLVSGYQLQYSTSKKFYKSKSKTVTVSKKNTSKAVSKLKSGKKYYVRVRAYKTINGKKVYGNWSSVKSIKVK
ncbi:MAG: GH25 family lysozyme [Eubacterium sp.]